jgi:hypothetical protein
MQRTLNRVRHENFHLAFAEILNVVIQSPVVDGLDCLLQDIGRSVCRSARVVLPVCTTTVFSGFWKPSPSTLNSYTPGGNCAKTSSPVSSLVADRDCPVSVFRTVTDAPRTNASDGPEPPR